MICSQLLNTIGYDANGKRRRKTVYASTKSEVQGKLLELQQRKMHGTISESAGEKVADFLHRWLEDVARVTVCEATYERYRELVTAHINPRIGGIRLERLSTADVQRIYSEMERAGSSPRTRRFVHAVLRRALSQAVEWSVIGRNVCIAAKPPKVPRKEMKTLSAIEASRFLAASKTDRLHALYVLALTTGMRQGELFALQWSDIDLSAASLSVRRTVTAHKQIKEPKTAKGKRPIDLSAMAVNALHEHRKQQLVDGLAGSPWVFCDTKGGLLSRHNIMSRSFLPILTKGNLPRIRFHDLRHTAASLMLSQGVHPKVVQEMLGHSSIAVTMDTYSHVLPTMQREAADKMQMLLDRTAS